MATERIWIVCEGEATPVEEMDTLPSRYSFGYDWLAVEAMSAEHAIEIAESTDAHIALDVILSTWSGLSVDRLAWHLADLGNEIDEDDGVYAVRFGCPRLDGRSRNHATGARELGLSVYLAEEQADGSWKLCDGPGYAIARSGRSLWKARSRTSCTGASLAAAATERQCLQT
jgi:hypothetical protein